MALGVSTLIGHTLKTIHKAETLSRKRVVADEAEIQPEQSLGSQHIKHVLGMQCSRASCRRSTSRSSDEAAPR